MDSPRLRLGALAVMIVTATLAGGTLTRADTQTFAEVMRRAHEYAVIYEDHELSTVIARERYQQPASPGHDHRDLRTPAPGSPL